MLHGSRDFIVSGLLSPYPSCPRAGSHYLIVKEGGTPLHDAAERGYETVITVLLEKGKAQFET